MTKKIITPTYMRERTNCAMLVARCPDCADFQSASFRADAECPTTIIKQAKPRQMSREKYRGFCGEANEGARGSGMVFGPTSGITFPHLPPHQPKNRS